MALNNELLQILACPKCKGSLELLGQEEGLKCTACAVVYPIREEIPVMLIDEAVPVARWDQGVREV
ncbi:MAG: Trm112 family protein [Desulfovibrionales bacterium]|nr:Trm112 family protein [Desulfovibrionales bacterium]